MHNRTYRILSRDSVPVHPIWQSISDGEKGDTEGRIAVAVHNINSKFQSLKRYGFRNYEDVAASRAIGSSNSLLEISLEGSCSLGH